MGQLEENIVVVKRFLDNEITIKDLAYIRYFFGLKVAGSENGMFISQQKYLLDMLTDIGLMKFKPVASPLPPEQKFYSSGNAPYHQPER